MIGLLKRLHKLLKKYGFNISLGIFSFNFLYRIVRTGLTDLLKKEVNKGDVFIDIGANIGYYSIVASKLVGKNGKIFAFEPDLINYKKLIKNLKRNRCNNIIPLNVAVSDKESKIKLFISEDNASDHRTYGIEGRKSVSIKSISLDDYFSKNNVTKVDFIKIDVQGYEPVVFKGMVKTLKNNRNIKIITEFWPFGLKSAGYDALKYLQDFSELGFKFFLVKERSKFAREISINEAMKLCPKKKSIDILCKR